MLAVALVAAAILTARPAAADPVPVGAVAVAPDLLTSWTAQSNTWLAIGESSPFCQDGQGQMPPGDVSMEHGERVHPNGLYSVLRA